MLARIRALALSPSLSLATALSLALSLALALTLAASAGCGPSRTTVPLDFGSGEARQVAGLAACAPEQPAARRLDPDRPLVVLVHGCNSSGGRFRSLASVFELHGQQTLCFNYDDRDSLRESADQLRTALRGVRRFMHDDRLTVIGHSQGGLVARAALSGSNEIGTPAETDPSELGSDTRLVTVSSPFAGIQMASDCGSVAMRIASLGITAAICQIVSGSNWSEIHPGSAMVLHPAPLSAGVEDHLVVMTDERGTCRRYDPEGDCDESDFVFSLEEQDNPLVLDDRRVQSEEIAAGHVEIVGEAGSQPRKLIEALQRHGILAATPPEKRQALAQLLRRLF